MLSHQYRTIFVHIPKCAGQSVEQVFLDRLGPEPARRSELLLKPNTDPRLGPERLAHLYASEYVARGHVTPEEFGSYFKFAIVRNPWARIVSEYKFAYEKSRTAFDDFLFRHFPKPGLSDARRHVEPQVKFLFDVQGNQLVDQIIRFENIADEMPKVFERIFGKPVALPSVNKSPNKRDFRSYFDDRSRAFVDDFYKDDIARFGYRFDAP